MTPYESRPASWRVGPVGSPIYSELVTEVAITDEAAGEFVEVRQSGRTDIGKSASTPANGLRCALRSIARCARAGKTTNWRGRWNERH